MNDKSSDLHKRKQEARTELWRAIELFVEAHRRDGTRLTPTGVEIPSVDAATILLSEAIDRFGFLADDAATERADFLARMRSR